MSVMIFHRYFVTVDSCDWASGITITLIRGRKGTSGPYFFKSVTLDGPGGLRGLQWDAIFSVAEFLKSGPFKIELCNLQLTQFYSHFQSKQSQLMLLMHYCQEVLKVTGITGSQITGQNPSSRRKDSQK